MLETPSAMLINSDALKDMLDDYEASELKTVLQALYDRAYNSVIPEDLPRELKPYFKLLWGTVEGGFNSQWKSQIFGSIKKSYKDDEFWLEWAKHEDYTDTLFREKEFAHGYSIAKETHRRLMNSRGLETPQGGLTIEYNGTKSNSNEGNASQPKTKGECRALNSNDLFTEWWELYPRKVDEHKAQKVWNSLVIDDTLCKSVFEGLEKWVRYWNARNEPDYIPYPAKWLTMRRWESEPPKVKRNSALEYDQKPISESDFDALRVDLYKET